MKMTFLRKKNYRNRVGFDPEKRSEGNDANLLLHYCLELVLAAKRVFFLFLGGNRPLSGCGPVHEYDW